MFFITSNVITIIILIYINSNYLIILINRIFLLKYTSNIYIRIITLLISIREININHHSTNKYILLKIIFLNKRNDKNVRANIIKKVYLISNLKTKVLLKTNIIELKKINIIILRN